MRASLCLTGLQTRTFEGDTAHFSVIDVLTSNVSAKNRGMSPRVWDRTQSLASSQFEAQLSKAFSWRCGGVDVEAETIIFQAVGKDPA